MLRNEVKELMFRPDETNNLVQQPPREPQVPTEMRWSRANCQVATKERVVAEIEYGNREIPGRQLVVSRKHLAKAMSALSFYGHCSPRCRFVAWIETTPG
jgi:hypothetical protein